MIGTGIPKHLSPRHHPLTEFVRKSGKRRLVQPKSSKTSPCEGDRHPSFFRLHGRFRLFRRWHFIEDACEPSPALRRIMKRKEFVASSESRRARQKNILYVVKFEHRRPPGESRAAYCIWSSINDRAPLTLNAFLTSSADT